MIKITSKIENLEVKSSKEINIKSHSNEVPNLWPRIYQHPSSSMIPSLHDSASATMSSEDSEVSKTGSNILCSDDDDDETDIHEDGVMSNPPVYENENNKSDNPNQQPRNHRVLPKYEKTYKLERFEKNFLIIFNQVHVRGYPRRVGTEKDVIALRKTLETFGFEVNTVTDATRDEIFSYLDEFTRKDFTNYGCVAVVFLTYGTEGGILQARHPPHFTEGDVLKRVMNKNPTLITKPRIVIFQASNCKNHLAGMRDEELSDMVYEDSVEGKQLYSLPVESDLLVIHSTFPGKHSHRTQHGSWFIQTLCNKINELAYTEDLESILVEVKRSVALKEVMTYNKSKGVSEISKQMPVITSTLIRKLYLKSYQNKAPMSYAKEHIEHFAMGNMDTTGLISLLKKFESSQPKKLKESHNILHTSN